jgi:penicillin-binding protein 1A
MDHPTNTPEKRPLLTTMLDPLGTGNKQKGPGWFFRMMFLLALAGTVIVTLIGAVVFWHFSHGLPKIITVEDYRPLTVTRILGAGGKEEAEIGEFYRERRYLVPYEKIPEVVVQAFISAEDDRFFEHQGVNLASILRASIANFRAGHVVQGGSTITQQVAKSLLLTRDKNFVRKIKEVILAGRMEKNLTKQQILYLYLNQIYLGDGAYGVQAAAKTYFRKDVSQLTAAEAAMLAGMPQAPGKYSPHLNPKKSKERQLYVLRRMYENNFISQSQMTEAAAQPVRIFQTETLEQHNAKTAPYLVEHIRRYLTEKYGEKAVLEDGLVVSVPTTPELTLVARKSLRDGLRLVDKRTGYRGPIKRLKGTEEMEKFLKEQRLSLISRKVGYEMLLPDGRLDQIDSMREAGLTSEFQLLVPEEVYPAVVTRVDDKAKVTGVMLGAIKAELPLDQMKWAYMIKDEKNPQIRTEPSAPSKVFSKGDVILVRLVSAKEEQVLVALEQEPQVQGAIFSVEAQTGFVLAMEGGYDFEHSEFNRAIQAQRQPGSAFKPIIYAAGLEKGFNPASIIVDAPIIYQDDQFGTWKPDNFETKFYGDTTYRHALIKSRNIPTIKIVQQINVPFLIDYSKRLGMNGQFNADLSISLGSATASLYDLTRVYSLFPRLGRRLDPIFLTAVHDRDGKLLEEQRPVPVTVNDKVPSAAAVAASPSPAASPLAAGQRPKVEIPQYPNAEDPMQIMDPRVAYVMTHLMKEVVNYGTGHEAKQLGRPAAGKTGTTNDYIDAWFMGFTPHVVTGAWVGFDSQKTIGTSETGAKAALPIWLSFMREAVKPYPDTDFPIPAGVVFATIDAATGKLAAPNSSNAIREAFIEGTEPTETVGSSPTSGDSTGDFLKEDIE